LALPAEQFGLSQTPTFDKFMADSVRIKADPYAVGCLPPGSMVKWTVPDAVPYWHGQKPFVEFDPLFKVDDWDALAGQKVTYAHVSEPGTITSLRPPDHRYDHILEEFGAKKVHPAERNDPAYLTIEPDPGVLVWTPPPGAFPEPDSETVLEFPKYEQRVGRWKCSVVVKVKRKWHSGQWYEAKQNRLWMQAEPLNGSNLPTYQRWMEVSAGAGKDMNKVFLDWVTEIEANPECCVKHKLIGRYDDTECVGQRSERPPAGLIPEEKSVVHGLFNPAGNYNYYQAVADMALSPSPLFTRLSGGDVTGQIVGGLNITSSPRTGYKLHGTLK
jgi:hypothetical protein